MTGNLLIGDIIKKKIRDRGGWVNCHAHFDRSYTVQLSTLDLAHQLMEKKWTLVDDMKRKSSEEDYFRRIEHAVRSMIEQGVTVCSTFIDVDPVTELRAILAAREVKKKYKSDITLLLINQVLKGVLDPAARRWAQKAIEYVDIIGGLPSKDRPYPEKHLDTLFAWAKETGKMVHVHIDQENNPAEHDTELLARKTIEFGLEGKVVAVHAISVSSQPAESRKNIYSLMKAAGLSVVCCPSAAIGMKMLPQKAILHNSIAPVAELLRAGIPVALGTDNISDIYEPLVDGDMYTELRILAAASRFYTVESLADIATVHGRTALGVS